MIRESSAREKSAKVVLVFLAVVLGLNLLLLLQGGSDFREDLRGLWRDEMRPGSHAPASSLPS